MCRANLTAMVDKSPSEVEIPEEDKITKTVNRNAIVELLAMLNISTYNLQVFEKTPAYKTDFHALQYMIKNNAIMGEYLLETFDIDIQEVIARVKKEIDDGFIKSVETPPEADNHGIEFR
jgi:hypothetical protein